MFPKIKNRLMALSLLCFFSIVFFPVLPHAQDNTALNGEDDAVSYETGIYYTIKKGDTLWDLSQKFFDSAFAWPSLWAQNQHIANPHLIYPGDRIRLYLKEGVEVVPKPIAITTEATVEETIEPVEEAAIIEKTPIQDTSEKDTRFFEYQKINQVGFIREKAVPPLGIIFKSKGDKKILGERDVIYIKQTGNTQLITGNLYTIYDTWDEPIKDSTTNKYVGVQHIIKGVVEISKIIKKNPIVVAATIVKNFRDIEIDDKILPYVNRSPKIAMSQSPPNLKARFLLAENHEKVFGQHFIAFINKGNADGIQPGQTYSIYEEETGRIKRGLFGKKSSKPETLMPIDFGSLVVLHTEKNTSTVLITQSDKGVFSETKVRTPVGQ